MERAANEDGEEGPDRDDDPSSSPTRATRPPLGRLIMLSERMEQHPASTVKISVATLNEY